MSSPLAGPALDQLFRTARSYNGYTDEAVGEAEVRAIWDLMKMAPTSANQLPARMVWCCTDAAKRRLADCASAQNAPKILSAPVSVVIGMDLEFHEHLPALFPHNPAAKGWFADAAAREVSAMRNSTLQGAYLIMAARALGLDTGPMSGFDHAKVDAAFFSDTPRVRSNFLSTIGHGDRATIFERSPRPAFETFNRIA